MENRSHSGGRSESYFPSWLLESTWDVAGPSQPPCRTPVMSPTRGAVKEAALASLRSWAGPRSEISPRGLRLGACGLLLLSPPWGRGMGAAGWAAWAGPRVTGRVSEALRPRRRGGADIGLWSHSMSAFVLGRHGSQEAIAKDGLPGLAPDSRLTGPVPSDRLPHLSGHRLPPLRNQIEPLPGDWHTISAQ